MSESPRNLPEMLQLALGRKRHSLFLTGNFDDLEVHGETVVYRRQALPLFLHEQGYLVVSYSLSEGGRIFKLASLPAEEKHRLEAHLKSFDLPKLFKKSDAQDQTRELTEIFRALGRLLQTRSPARPIALIISYLEHLAPRVTEPTAAQANHLIVSECLHALSTSAALKKFNNVLICIGREGLHNELLNDLTTIRFPYPDEKTVTSFFELMSGREND